MAYAPKSSSKPRRSGFKQTGALLAKRIRGAGESRGFAVTRLLTHWAEVAGPDLAPICQPVDVTFGRRALGATLTVLTTGAQAPMLEMQKEMLRARVNACYGYNAIARIHITQSSRHGVLAPGGQGLAEGQSPFAARGSNAATPAPPDVVKAAEERAAPVQDPGLREALAALGTNVLRKKSENRIRRPE